MPRTLAGAVASARARSARLRVGRPHRARQPASSSAHRTRCRGHRAPRRAPRGRRRAAYRTSSSKSASAHLVAPGLRQEREDPAAVVVDDDEARRRRRGRSAPTRPFASCRKHRSPSSATTGVPRRAAATPSTVDTKPSIPLTPRFAKNSMPSRGAANASTSRTGMLEATTRRAPPGRHATRSRATLPSNGSSFGVADARRARAARVVRHRATRRRQSRDASAPVSRARRPRPRAAPPASHTARIEAPRSGSSHALVGIEQPRRHVGGRASRRAALLVGGRTEAEHGVGPVRVGEPGRCAAAPRRSTRRAGPTRSPESGSASTGQPAALDEPLDRRRTDTPRPHPATTTPRGCARTNATSVADDVGVRCRCVRARVVDPRRAVGASRRLDEWRARRDERLAEREVEVHRARRRSRARGPRHGPRADASRAPAPGASSGGPGSCGPAQRVAVEVALLRRSGRRRRRGAPAGDRRCRRRAAPAPWCASSTAAWQERGRGPRRAHEHGRSAGRPRRARARSPPPTVRRRGRARDAVRRVRARARAASTATRERRRHP